jgi:CubicO group peptidase (beta-lactamase class C family)
VSQTRTAPAGNKLKNYGYQFWLNGKDEENTLKRKYPDVPADMFYCDGFGYQFIYIIPSEKLVVVRLGLTLDRSFDENAFLKEIIESVHSER